MELIREVTGGGEFSNANHLQTLRGGRRDGQKDRGVANKIKLKGLGQDLKGTYRLLILRSKIKDAFLSVSAATF